MCAVWEPAGCAVEVGKAVADSALDQVAQAVTEAVAWVITTSIGWWVMLPSVDLENTPAETLRKWMLPIVVLVATGGTMWQALLVILSRKPAPLVNILRGLWNTALWGAVGIFGTNLALRASDGYSTWILGQAVGNVSAESLGARMQVLLVPAAVGMPKGIVLIIGILVLVATFIQALLMLFRDGSVIILAGLLQLAAAGSFTNATSGWSRKVLAWLLTLVTYKPIAATVYAVAILLLGDPKSQDPRTFFMGVAMLVVSLVALPVLTKFFSWTVGSLQGGGGLGMFAAAGAAGIHAGASLRGVGGRGANEHARYLDTSLGGNADGPSGTPPGPSPLGPRDNGPPGPGTPPTFRGPTGGAPAAAAATTGGGGFAASAAPAASSAAGASAGTGAVAAGSAAAGPAAPVVAGVALGVKAVADTAKAGANTAASAISDATRDR